jgi:hypothetical protein
MVISSLVARFLSHQVLRFEKELQLHFQFLLLQSVKIYWSIFGATSLKRLVLLASAAA